jgi:hypothetical protein
MTTHRTRTIVLEVTVNVPDNWTTEALDNVLEGLRSAITLGDLECDLDAALFPGESYGYSFDTFLSREEFVEKTGLRPGDDIEDALHTADDSAQYTDFS